MNLMLFPTQSDTIALPYDQAQASHVRTVLRMKVGDSFDIGCVNGPRGKGKIITDNPKEGMILQATWGIEATPPLPITLILGLPRPQTARKLLNECTSIGVSHFHFFQSEKGEVSYATSKLWTSGEWQRHLRQGAEQAFTTYIPTVTHSDSLEKALASIQETETIPVPKSSRVALDLYEATQPLHSTKNPKSETTILALGPERGWSPTERDVLRKNNFLLASLGERVLRQETAAIAAISILSANQM